MGWWNRTADNVEPETLEELKKCEELERLPCFREIYARICNGCLDARGSLSGTIHTSCRQAAIPVDVGKRS